MKTIYILLDFYCVSSFIRDKRLIGINHCLSSILLIHSPLSHTSWTPALPYHIPEDNLLMSISCIIFH